MDFSSRRAIPRDLEFEGTLRTHDALLRQLSLVAKALSAAAFGETSDAMVSPFPPVSRNGFPFPHVSPLSPVSFTCSGLEIIVSEKWFSRGLALIRQLWM